ncbi:MAG: hypothetical protein AB8G96_16420 [Phycisphaerales bacterium]
MFAVRDAGLRRVEVRDGEPLGWSQVIRMLAAAAVGIWLLTVVWSGVREAQANADDAARPQSAAWPAVAAAEDAEAAARRAAESNAGRPRTGPTMRDEFAVRMDVAQRAATPYLATGARSLDRMASHRAGFGLLAAAAVFLGVLAGRPIAGGRDRRALTRALAAQRVRRVPIRVPTCGTCAASRHAWPAPGAGLPGVVRVVPLDPRTLDAPAEYAGGALQKRGNRAAIDPVATDGGGG